MRKALLAGRLLLWWCQFPLLRNAMRAFRVILRFPYPSEIKTSPKSWRLIVAFRPRWRGIDGCESIRGGINQMATKDGFQPDRSPIFLSRHAEETEQPDIGRAWDIATISSRILKTSILAVTVTAIGIAILSIGNPVALVANVTDWWVDKPALQPDADPSTSTIQSIASTQDLPPTTTDAPPRDEIAAAVEPADQSRAEASVRAQAVRASRSEPGRDQPATH